MTVKRTAAPVCAALMFAILGAQTARAAVEITAPVRLGPGPVNPTIKGMPPASGLGELSSPISGISIPSLESRSLSLAPPLAQAPALGAALVTSALTALPVPLAMPSHARPAAVSAASAVQTLPASPAAARIGNDQSLALAAMTNPDGSTTDRVAAGSQFFDAAKKSGPGAGLEVTGSASASVPPLARPSPRPATRARPAEGWRREDPWRFEPNPGRRYLRAVAHLALHTGLGIFAGLSGSVLGLIAGAYVFGISGAIIGAYAGGLSLEESDMPPWTGALIGGLLAGSASLLPFVGSHAMGPNPWPAVTVVAAVVLGFQAFLIALTQLLINWADNPSHDITRQLSTKRGLARLLDRAWYVPLMFAEASFPDPGSPQAFEAKMADWRRRFGFHLDPKPARWPRRWNDPTGQAMVTVQGRIPEAQAKRFRAEISEPKNKS